LQAFNLLLQAECHLGHSCGIVKTTANLTASGK
jgi:hypothetical protein